MAVALRGVRDDHVVHESQAATGELQPQAEISIFAIHEESRIEPANVAKR